MNKRKNKEKHNNIPAPSIEKNMEEASLFTHTILSNYAHRINAVETFLYGMADTLMKKGIIEKDDIKQSAIQVQQEIREKGEELHPGLALRVDGKQKQDFVSVNCNERMHICKAVCCKLDFALNAREVESGKLKWELGRPYYIRHKSNGYCIYWEEEEPGCSIYDDRPPTCKAFSCANDKRLWKDFDNMVLNQEWIDKFLRGKRTFLAAVEMNRLSDEKL